MADEAELRAELVRVAQSLDRAGFYPSKSVSARWRDGLLITPTGRPYANMRPEDIVELNLSGSQRAGARDPSSEWPFHSRIYRASGRRSDRPHAQPDGDRIVLRPHRDPALPTT